MATIAFAVTAGNPRGEDPGITIHGLDPLRPDLDVTPADPGQDARGQLDEARADALLKARGWTRTRRWIYDSGQWGAHVEEGPADMDQALQRMRAYKAATAGRDAIVRYALRAGANVNQVSTETGISRPTIYRIREAMTGGGV
ncbi:MAG: hypothetical protein FWE35_00885 [Streptosporangiales bacterium]|nr:hypothetical protein [Streptosporangiales bacterium]